MSEYCFQTISHQPVLRRYRLHLRGDATVLARFCLTTIKVALYKLSKCCLLTPSKRVVVFNNSSRRFLRPRSAMKLKWRKSAIFVYNCNTASLWYRVLRKSRLRAAILKSTFESDAEFNGFQSTWKSIRFDAAKVRRLNWALEDAVVRFSTWYPIGIGYQVDRW